jgi:hypothetical protein
MTKELEQQLLNAIYWKSFSKDQKDAIDEILQDKEASDKGTDICDVLGIERRGNRNEIRKVIEHE